MRKLMILAALVGGCVQVPQQPAYEDMYSWTDYRLCHGLIESRLNKQTKDSIIGILNQRNQNCQQYLAIFQTEIQAEANKVASDRAQDEAFYRSMMILNQTINRPPPPSVTCQTYKSGSYETMTCQ